MLQYPESFWRSLRHLNAFRLYLGIFFVLSGLFADRYSWLARESIVAFTSLAFIYALMTWPIGRMLHARRPGFEQQLVGHLFLDSMVVVILMHLGGGKDTGLGLLVMVFMAAAGLHGRTRAMLLIPTVAALALIVEQEYAFWQNEESAQGFFQTGMLAVGFFMVASLSHVLARGTLAAAELADAREMEVASLEKVNARVIQDLPYAVLVVDGQDRLIQANSQAAAWLECRLAPHTEIRVCAPALSALLDAWKRRDDKRESLFKTPEGRHFRARVMELDVARREGAVIVLEDLSELEREAQKLKLAALGRLTANLAHEIRNPLSAVRHAAQLLAEDVPTHTPVSRLTRIIEDNVGRLDRMVEDVLLLNRRDRLAREPILLAGYLEEFVAQFLDSEHLAEETIQLDVADDATAEFDRTHLHQILWNLLRNALRHCSRTPGSIRVGAANRSGRCILEVYNDGEPIPSDLVARLFEPFYTTDSRGTGLGLHIARELAEANGAELSCQAREVGALFRLTCESTAK